jgi:hypothetical protein
MSATNAKLDAEKHRLVVQLMGLHRPRDVDVSADARASVFQVLLSMRWAYPNISAAVQQELYRLCASRLVSPGAGDLPLFNVCHAVRPLTADQVRKRVGVTVSVRHMRGFRVSRPDVSPRPCPEWPSRATGAATSPRSRGQGGNPHVLTGSRPSVCVCPCYHRLRSLLTDRTFGVPSQAALLSQKLQLKTVGCVDAR